MKASKWSTFALSQVVLAALAVLISYSTIAQQSETISSFEGRANSALYSGQFQIALSLLDSALSHQSLGGNPEARARLQVQRALAFQALSQYNLALKELFKARAYRESVQDTSGLAEVFNNIGAIYHTDKDYAKAQKYYGLSLDLYTGLGEERRVGQALNNIGALLEDMGQPLDALEVHRRSRSTWQKLNESSWVAISDIHIGVCYSLMLEYDSAEHYLLEGHNQMTRMNRESEISNVAILLGELYRSKGENTNSQLWCEQGFKYAEIAGLPLYQQRACECLYQAYEKQGDRAKALSYFKRCIALRDSVFSQEQAKEITRLEMDHVFTQEQLADSLKREEEKLRIEMDHQLEVSRKEKARNVFLATGLILLLLAGGLWSRMRLVRRAKSRIEREKDRSENLLLNILPSEIAEELKESGRSEARDFDNVTILFTDFKGFTSIAEKLTPQDLVKEINTCFEAFDHIMDKWGVEKIKTIGDAYMAAGGLPIPSDDSVVRTVMAALEMQEFMIKHKKERDSEGRPAFQMRVGMHTGPVVAGIVGVKKFQYDVWGDTVNTASRMESSGEVDLVNISESTYRMLEREPGFSYDFRGMVQAKGKGELKMYFVSREIEAQKNPVAGATG